MPAHPLDGASRTRRPKNELGTGLCNITKCCSEVCPEYIHITDNAIIPLKEPVVGEFSDPLWMAVRKVRERQSGLSRRKGAEAAREAPWNTI